MIRTEELLSDLKRVRDKIGMLPSRNLYREHGKYNTATFHRHFGSWNKALLECFGAIIQERPKNRPVIKCLRCHKETKNPKFCSSSCAAIYNNKQRKHEDNNCIRCGKKIRSICMCCKECLPFYKIEKYGEKTIREFREIPASKNRYQNVRNHAHRVAALYGIIKKCSFCDCNNHLDLCHIEDIGTFTDDTQLNIINSPTNLIYLCPNHHWDLDHGYLKIEK